MAVGAFDAHLGAVGSRHRAGHIGEDHWHQHVRHDGRAAVGDKLADIPGLCGIVPGSILPGYYGLEAGQSAVGDIFNWFVNYIQPLGKEGGLA